MEAEVTPRIGRYWDGHGGIYAGITRREDGDYHLILSEADTKRDMTLAAAQAWVHTVKSSDHAVYWDLWRLPTRKEAALLYANLQDKFDALWYWTGEVYHADKECAWVQTFGYGRQADARKTDACRARAVRIEPL